MNQEFDRMVYCGLLVRGNLKGAMAYLRQYPEYRALYQKYEAVFEREEYLIYPEDAEIDALLQIYQKYYREVFFLEVDAKKAEENMKNRFAAFLGIDAGKMTFRELEETQIADSFRKKCFQFLGGETSGYYGPYIWKTTELKTYDVELPEGNQSYPVQFLDGFIAKSWLDYLSFGKTGTGGWSNGDGLLNCVRAVYDLASESFQVSFLKHEAQHAMDLARYPEMQPTDLEYRAKLVELIYTKERNLLAVFAQDADTSNKENGHALAASRIAEEFTRESGGNPLSIAETQSIARKLLQKSNEEIKEKYAH
jgi:hypothetical protein